MKKESKFFFLKGKKILIYGTGTIAKRLIRLLSGFNIIGIIDRVQFIGEIDGIPIRIWDEIYEGDAEIVIIAALIQHHKEIYDRIVDKCIAYDMKIYDSDGNNLISYYGIMGNEKANSIFFSKNEMELVQKIRDYEAISFDLFDTLIMRKTLEPADLFDIVNKRIQEKNIIIQDFKKIRRKAELMSGGKDIYEIYNIFQKLSGLSVEECNAILHEEIKCEKEYIIPRKRMVDIMSQAVALGKKVNIITNMYLPEKILSEILKEKDIIGYEKIYVSCEYGMSKGEGLFQKYLEDTVAFNYLHVGDDSQEDGVGARKYNINTYEIKSAYDMLKVSNFRHVLAFVCNKNEKGMLGLLISELFNNPFALYKSNGIVEISEFKVFGKIFVAPIVVNYMLKLIDFINELENCQGILFGSRDGYLLKKIYDKLCSNRIIDIQEKSSWYFIASRKLCLKSAMITEDNIKVLKDYKNECGDEEILTNILGISTASHYDAIKYPDISEYFLEYKDKIFDKSGVTRRNYYKYMDKCGISRAKKYILCELTSQGTVQYALNQIFEEPLYGFYLCKRKGFVHFEVNTKACFQEMEENVRDIIENNNFLESILTSPEPSVVDMNENGEPVFASDDREDEEIEGVMSVQDGIEEFFFEYIEKMFIKGQDINKNLPQFLLKMYKEVWLKGECLRLEKRKLYDDLGNRYYIV